MGASDSKKPTPSRLRSNVDNQLNYGHGIHLNNEPYNFDMTPNYDEFDRTNHDFYRRTDLIPHESDRTFKPDKYEKEPQIERKNTVRNRGIVF